MGSFLRTPLGLFAAIVVVGVVLILAAMSAFGGTSGATPRALKPLSQAQFNRAGVHICLSMRSQLRWLATHKPKNLRQLQRYIARGTAIFDHLTTQVAGLVPPPKAAASFRHVLGLLGRGDRAMHRLNHLTRTHQWRQAYLFVHSAWWRHLFKEFGPHVKLRDIHCSRTKHTSA